jgi:hypothetical protein
MFESRSLIENVSVDQAIRRAHVLINFPVFLIILGSIVASVFMVAYFGYSSWMYLLTIPSGVVLAWLYWSIAITRWRLWAFHHVRNVHELKQRAFREKIIWREGSFWEKTEFRTRSDREKWNWLQQKFAREDVFIDDPLVPSQTVIVYSRFKIWLSIVLMLVIFLAGLMFIVRGEKIWIGLPMLGIGVYAGIRQLKKAFTSEPRIILSGAGVKVFSVDFVSWADVYDAESYVKGTGKNAKGFLEISHRNGDMMIPVDEFNVSVRRLNKLLMIYRGRFKKNSETV